MFNANEGNRVKIIKDGLEYRGIVMPSPKSKDTLVLKLASGYNIGIKIDEKTKIEIMGDEKFSISKPKRSLGERESEKTKRDLVKKSLPKVSIISTGGTIASRVDYRTGAVTSQFKAEDIMRAIPELSDIATYDSEIPFNILSENMSPKHWIKLARLTYDKIKKGSYGVIITHGTDTMGFTSSSLSFMLRTPVPVVLVGSQRSSDRPSSDSYVNAICAARVATSDISEVSVVMHGSTSDDFCLIHGGTKVRKMHTSRRDAFHSVNSSPLGRVIYPGLEIEEFQPHKRRGEEELRLYDKLEERCALIKFYPGADPNIIDFYVDDGYKGLVIEGTGLGHVSSEWIPQLKADIPIVITSQCIYGRVCDRVYGTGREMLKAGVIEGEDMLPETALTKLMWVLGQTDDLEEVRSLMQKNIVGEITRSSITS
ncbi:MAG: Glu-tRNA(Gln) amidotransferase subunit GatD [Candidatus Methanolliviera hydrocarbonicum]|uniref:Glutamyl-tRNA(Gln) amidotransferase subunit D n=1 Tax=Candidatus Methanolliviera hydrocarbonicum TaxID=2491085 RepID=A0A520KUY2_9EURY|nr:MAG: Glu-tRNA(Gln) amidotransferase subunit GatD [Candidatus Methanolliviera hydrocarbonicum]